MVDVLQKALTIEINMETHDLSIPDANTMRYDRQIRLWAQSGQEALGNSHILLLGVTPTGSEILKNMVLSGIQGFTIVDNEEISSLDANNFFIDGSEGCKRGENFVKLIRELNPQVEGNYLDLDPVTVIHKPMFFDKFSAVVVCMGLQLNEVFVTKVSEILYDLGIPMVAVDTSGFMGIFRLSYHEHPVIETHPESFNDLRLEAPIPGLEAWVEAIDFESSSEKHGNIPFAAILFRFIKLWAQGQSDCSTFPSNYKQKQELKKIITSGMLNSDEENFEQAIAAVNSMVQARKVPAQVLAIFQNPKCQNIDMNSSEFWILARALYEYYQAEGKGVHLPLPGLIPDMKSDTQRYIELQKLYKEQASRDVQAVKAHLNNLQSDAVRNITDQQIATLCKNAYHIHLTESIPLHLEWSKTSPVNLEPLCANTENLWLWLAFRARHHVVTTSNKLLGQGPNANMEKDIAHLLKAIGELINLYSLDPTTSLPSEEFAKQFLIQSNNELATTASILGGLIAQELTKIFTKQYVPAASTCIFDGLSVGAIPINILLKDDRMD